MPPRDSLLKASEEYAFDVSDSSDGRPCMLGLSCLCIPNCIDVTSCIKSKDV